MGDFVKTNDQEFRAQAALANTVISLNPTDYGQTSSSVIVLQDKLDNFTNDKAEQVAALEAAKSATDDKDASRADLEATFREFNRVAQAVPGITDGQLAAAGLPVHESNRSALDVANVRPEIRVVTLGQEHNIAVINPDNGKANRPTGVRGIELFRAMVSPGEPLPSGIDQMTMVGTFFTSRIALQYTSGDIGKTVVYLARYVGTNNAQGPAGSISAASIAA